MNGVRFAYTVEVFWIHIITEKGAVNDESVR